MMDCDGVLTDGRLYYSSSGESLKVFDVRDGQGIANWHASGSRSGIITGRGGDILEVRAAELGIEFVRSRSRDKAADLAEILPLAGVKQEEVAFIGDDVGDMGVMEAAGLSIAVADAVDDVIAIAAYVTTHNGGRGAVREVIDLLLKSRQTA
jgi:3-deoxy-D-manno-octulosonate 8-phosphate phosphatase (KDO 8-P phosphatase)